MQRAELKQQAKDTLRGKWGKAIGLSLVYYLLVSAILLVCKYVYIVGPIVSIVITVPLSFGYIGVIIKFTRGEKTDYLDFFTNGFVNFGKAWSIAGYTILKLIGYYIAFFVCLISFVGFVIAAMTADSLAMLVIGVLILTTTYFIISILLATQSYFYVLTNYIGNDMKEMSGRDVVAKSKELMKGHRFEFFVLQLSFLGWKILAYFFGLLLSFLGWKILAVLTSGIGFIWLMPYMKVTYVKYYESLIYENGNNSEKKVILEQ